MCVPRCRSYEVWTGSQCDCAPGCYRINGVCGKCGVNEDYDPITQTCVCKNGYSKKGGICTIYCDDPWIYNPIEERCQCKSGTYLINGECGTCNIG